MASSAAIFSAGLFAWTFLEYLIHGWLSHTFETFATALHATHHHDPHAVFAIRAWIPTLLIWSGGLAIFGTTPAMLFLSGLVCGFACYEALHYRIHFARCNNRYEAHLRRRHLFHHYASSDLCFGVTSALWDLVFGTEPMGERMRAMAAATASIQRLEGRSNVRCLLSFWPAARQ